MKKIPYILFLGLFLFIFSCDDDDDKPTNDGRDLKGIAYNPTDYTPVQPSNFPTMEIPPDNPMTHEKIDLGRNLFYDPILSLDSTISCGSCHLQEKSFAADVAISEGVGGSLGTRNSMPLVNLGYSKNGLNWDGSADELEDQHLIPVEHPLEMQEKWSNVEKKLRRHDKYPEQFRKAFGIENSNDITKDMTVKAIATFVRTLVSYKSRYDWASGFVDPDNRPFLEEDEARGAEVYFTETGAAIGEAECTHCHGGPLFTDNSYRNNGLDELSNVNDFADKGRGGANNSALDMGKFRVPPLRNIMLTAPYMHDGRFATIEEVMAHYNEHIKISPTLDNLLADRLPGIQYSQDTITDIISFLDALTDTSFINNPDFSNPFE